MQTKLNRNPYVQRQFSNIDNEIITDTIHASAQTPGNEDWWNGRKEMNVTTVFLVAAVLERMNARMHPTMSTYSAPRVPINSQDYR